MAVNTTRCRSSRSCTLHSLRYYAVGDEVPLGRFVRTLLRQLVQELLKSGPEFPGLAEGLTLTAGLRWENKENIWFLHHWPPALPLGHNCSNPSLRLSA
jgi:hypothetical protein